MKSWGEKRIAGVVYDLRHLDDIYLDVTPRHEGAPTYRVQVSFGAHTFTKALSDGDKPDLHVEDGGEIRCFCVVRHSCSLHLPDIIRAAMKGSAYFGNKHQKYLLIENLPKLNAPYVIAFKMERAQVRRAHAIMFVVSAHERPNLPKNLPRIGVATLISLTVQGKQIVRPNKK